MRTIHFIINKLSPKAKVIEQTVLNEVDRSLFNITFKLSEYKGHTVELTKASIQEGVDAVVACGGDGTINEVAQCLVNTETALAILPVGSGNGLARHLRIPSEISKALALLQKFESRKIDVGQANEHLFFCNASFAFSAQVIHCYDDLPNRGVKAYSQALFKAISVFKYKTFQVQEQESTVRLTPFVLMVSNTDQLGYNRSLTPDASIFDGKLDLVYIERYSPLLLGVFMFFALFRKFPPFVKVNRNQLKEIKLTCDETTVNIQIDGEKLVLNQSSVKITLIPSAIKVIC